MTDTRLNSERKGKLPKRLVATISSDYLLAHLGFFTILPILPVLLEERGFGPAEVGVSLVALSVTMKGASLFLAKFLHRIDIGKGSVLGLIMSAIGFSLSGFTQSPPAIMGLLAMAGTGISINALLVRGLIGVASSDPSYKNKLFAALQVIINVAAALGPIVANLMLDSVDTRLIYAAVGSCYVIAAITMLILGPRVRLSEGASRPPLGLKMAYEVVRPGTLRQLTLISIIGSIGYAQFFSAAALVVNEVSDDSLVRASVFVVNAIAVVLLQGPATYLINRLTEKGGTFLQVLCIGAGLFGIAFIPMAFSHSSIVWLFVGVVGIAIAETIFTPTVSTAFVHEMPDRPMVESLNFRQLATSGGESIGVFLGGAFYLTFSRSGFTEAYWLLMAAVISVSSLLILLRTNALKRRAR